MKVLTRGLGMNCFSVLVFVGRVKQDFLCLDYMTLKVVKKLVSDSRVEIKEPGMVGTPNYPNCF